MISKNIYDIIESIAATSSRTGKEALLRQHKDVLKPILQATYDPYKTYGINKLPQGSMTPPRINWVRDLLSALEKRELTGNAAQQEVASWLGVMSEDVADLFGRILKKDLRMGVSAKTINKVIPGCVPEFGCMLAQPFDPSRAKFPMLAQPKLDGVRVIADINVDTGVVLFFSRSGKPFTTFDHLAEPLLDLCKNVGESHIRLDGEIITGSFNKTVSEARRKDSQALDAQYHIFDWIDEKRAQKPYIERYMALMDLAKKAVLHSEPPGNGLWVVSCRDVALQSEADNLYQEFLDQGYEGLMLKDPNAPYQHKRSYAWMKMKEEQSIDTPIVGWEWGTGKYEGMIGAFLIEHNGVRVKVGSGLTDELRDANPVDYLQRLIEVSYQHETPDGSLRHPRFKRFRDTEDAPGVKV
jgi:DNA ligase 1